MRRLPALLAAAGLLCCRSAASMRAPLWSSAAAAAAAEAQREAYVTFVASEDYVLGARVLGQSLRESGTSRVLLCLVAAPLSQRSRAALARAGWALQAVPAVASPHADVAPRKLLRVYAKLAVFGLADFARVVYLDADTLVAPGHARGADALFACRAQLCAALRHSERWNSGVMVVRPSAALHANMSALITVLPSYTGGDQGFLNSYFDDLPAAPLFDPQRDATSPGDVVSGASSRVLRLPTAYNADVGLYVLNGERWPLPASSLRVLHFTLGPLKPWHWPATWLVPAAATWQDVRRRTPPPPGPDPTPLLFAALLATPLLAIGPLLRRRRLLLSRGASWGSAAAAAAAATAVLAAATPRSHRGAASCFAARLLGSATAAPFRPLTAPPGALTALALAAALPGGAACVALAALLPPATSPPRIGWAAFMLWSLALSSLLFGAVLECAHACGRAAAARACADATGVKELAMVPQAAVSARRAERITRLAAMSFAAAFIAAPWLPRAAGARGAPAMLGAAAAAAAALAAAAAAVAPPLAAAWYAAGLAAGAPLAPAEEAMPVAWRHVVVKPPNKLSAS